MENQIKRLEEMAEFLDGKARDYGSSRVSRDMAQVAVSIAASTVELRASTYALQADLSLWRARADSAGKELADIKARWWYRVFVRKGAKRGN